MKPTVIEKETKLKLFFNKHEDIISFYLGILLFAIALGVGVGILIIY